MNVPSHGNVKVINVPSRILEHNRQRTSPCSLPTFTSWQLTQRFSMARKITFSELTEQAVLPFGLELHPPMVRSFWARMCSWRCVSSQPTTQLFLVCCVFFLAVVRTLVSRVVICFDLGCNYLLLSNVGMGVSSTVFYIWFYNSMYDMFPIFFP